MMSLEYIRKTYGVSAKRKGEVRYSGELVPKLGTIVGSNGQYLRVRFVGEKHTRLLHPTWKVEYLTLRT